MKELKDFRKKYKLSAKQFVEMFNCFCGEEVVPVKNYRVIYYYESGKIVPATALRVLFKFYIDHVVEYES